MRLALYLVAFTGVLWGAATMVVLAGRRRFRRRVTGDVTALFSNVGVSIGPDQLKARWDALPEPVRRYLGYAISEGAPAIRTARLKHDGLFRTTPGQQWFRIEGEQYFTVGAPGFVWHASIQPAPLLWIEARDRLASGQGNMLVKLASTIPLADAVGPEIDQGARLRWLAECAWLPFAFVGDAVQWEPIDADSARASLRCDGLPVGAIVEVDDEGKLTHVRADRYRARPPGAPRISSRSRGKFAVAHAMAATDVGEFEKTVRHDTCSFDARSVGVGARRLSLALMGEYPEDTHLANLHVTLMEKMGVQIDKIGDSDGTFNEQLSV